MYKDLYFAFICRCEKVLDTYVKRCKLVKKINNKNFQNVSKGNISMLLLSYLKYIFM